MAWTVWAADWQAGELSDTTLYQPFRMNADTIVLAVRTWFVVYNDPTFTSLNAKIYSDELRSGVHTPVKLLHTSDSRTKAQLHSQEYGVRETWFEFDPSVPLQGDTWYNLVINGVGYAPTSNSYLAWRHAYPDPVLATDYVANPLNINAAPFDIYFIGGTY